MLTAEAVPVVLQASLRACHRALRDESPRALFGAWPQVLEVVSLRVFRVVLHLVLLDELHWVLAAEAVTVVLQAPPGAWPRVPKVVLHRAFPDELHLVLEVVSLRVFRVALHRVLPDESRRVLAAEAVTVVLQAPPGAWPRVPKVVLHRAFLDELHLVLEVVSLRVFRVALHRVLPDESRRVLAAEAVTVVLQAPPGAWSRVSKVVLPRAFPDALHRALEVVLHRAFLDESRQVLEVVSLRVFRVALHRVPVAEALLQASGTLQALLLLPQTRLSQAWCSSLYPPV